MLTNIRKKKLNYFSKVLGYKFNNLELLNLALCHRSYQYVHNERLEFLGDSVLGVVVTHMLYKKFSYAEEGQLSILRSSLIKGDTLTIMANKFNLGSYLNLGIGEVKAGGRERSSILENSFEAIIGAIYLDSDFNQVKKVVISWYSSYINSDLFKKVTYNFKSQLQEYLQEKKYQLPKYVLVKTNGKEHNQIFYIECQIVELNLKELGEGTRKKQAEQIAAKNTINKLNIQL